MTNYEKGLEKLNNELAASREYAANRNNRAEEISIANLASIKALFNTTLELRHFRKEWSYRDESQNKWSISFQQSGRFSFNNLEFEFNVIEDNIQVVKYGCPSLGGSEMNELVQWFNEVNQVITTLSTRGQDIVYAINRFEKLEDADETIRNENEILRDIEDLQNMKRNDSVGLRVGAVVMLDIHGPYARYSSNWQKVTITKINEKSIKYVTHIDLGDGKFKVSNEQGLRFNWNYVRSLEEHEEKRQQEIDREWIRQKRWHPEITREEVKVYSW